MGDILSPSHLLFVLVVALIVLGPKRLPEVGRSLGKGLRDFRGAMSGIQDEITGATDPDGSTGANVSSQTAPSAPAPMVQSTPMAQSAPASAMAATAVVDQPVLNAAPSEVVTPVAPVETVDEASERVFGVPAVPEPTPAATVLHEPLPSEYAD